MFEFGCVQEVD